MRVPSPLSLRQVLAAVLLVAGMAEGHTQEQVLKPRWSVPLPRTHYLIGFSADGQTLLTAAETKLHHVDRIHHWNVSNGKELGSFPIDEVQTLRYARFMSNIRMTADGKSLFVFYRDKQFIKHYSVAQAKLVATISPSPKPDSSISLWLSPDGQILYLRYQLRGSKKNQSEIQAWDHTRQKLLFTLPKAKEVRLSPCGRYLLTFSYTGYFDPDDDPLFAPKEQEVDKSLYAWDARTGKALAKIETPETVLDFLSDGNAVLIDGKLYDTGTWKMLIHVKGIKPHWQSFSSDGAWMISLYARNGGGSFDNSMTAYGFIPYDLLKDMRQDPVVVYNKDSIFSVQTPQFIPQTKIVAVPLFPATSPDAKPRQADDLSSSNHLLFYDLASRKRFARLSFTSSFDYCCAPDGKCIAVVNNDKTGPRLELVDVSSPKP